MAPGASVLAYNWRLKLSALGLSVFLWALVQTEPRDQETFSTVPVLLEVADTMWTVSGAPNPPTVSLILGGPTREINSLAREGTSLRIPVAEVGSRDTVITVRREWVELGERLGVVVEAVSPPTIGVSFEPAATRIIPLAMRVRGVLPQNLALANEVTLNPRRVTVRGPESRVLGLDSIRLESFDLSDVSEPGIFTLQVDTSGLAGGSVVPTTATMAVRVEEVVERLLGVPVSLDPGDGEAELVSDPLTVQVRLSGARTLVTAFDAVQLRLWVAPELLRGMVPGETRRVPIILDGVPALVAAEMGTDVVTVRRATDQDGGGDRRFQR